jgi:hypothetical protein
LLGGGLILLTLFFHLSSLVQTADDTLEASPCLPLSLEF